MGVEFTCKIDPKLKEMAQDFISGTRDIADIAVEKSRTWNASSYTELLRNWMTKQAYVPLRKAVYGYAHGCMLATPVKTGNARRNWHISSENSITDISYIDMRTTPVSAEVAAAEMENVLQAEVKAAVGKAEGHSAGPRESIQVTNYTSYIGTLESRVGMTASGMAEMLTAMGDNS